MTCDVSMGFSQGMTDWQELPDLPETVGRGGMFAGVSHGHLLCMGGANFPGAMPWEGGKKRWHADVFMLENDDRKWVKLDTKLPYELGYGVSASYGEKIILVGGSNAEGHKANTWMLEWKGHRLSITEYAPLPRQLANMGGTNVNNLLIVTGGMEGPLSNALHVCYLLELDNPEAGWQELPVWPGPERIFPVCGSDGERFYLFSGENTITDAIGKPQRNILRDAYAFSPKKDQGKWSGQWLRLKDTPKGMSGGANPAPWLNRVFVCWGGVDEETALYTDPANHPGIPGTACWYDPKSDAWKCDPAETTLPGRVTLPTVSYKGHAYYVSGEIKPGVRTNKVSEVVYE